MASINRTQQLDRDRKTLAAIQKYLMKMTAITIAGVTRTPQEIMQLFQTSMQLADAATQAQASFHAATTAVRDQQKNLRQFRIGFRHFLENTFTDPGILAEFGLTPRKVATKSSETKAAAAAKNVATRKARNTMGSKQKKAIKGDVTGVVVTPITVPKAEAHPAPAPAAPASPAPTNAPAATPPQTPGANPIR
jgi:hypothetical protein